MLTRHAKGQQIKKLRVIDKNFIDLDLYLTFLTQKLTQKKLNIDQNAKYKSTNKEFFLFFLFQKSP